MPPKTVFNTFHVIKRIPRSHVCIFGVGLPKSRLYRNFNRIAWESIRLRCAISRKPAMTLDAYIVTPQRIRWPWQSARHKISYFSYIGPTYIRFSCNGFIYKEFSYIVFSCNRFSYIGFSGNGLSYIGSSYIEFRCIGFSYTGFSPIGCKHCHFYRKSGGLGTVQGIEFHTSATTQ